MKKYLCKICKTNFNTFDKAKDHARIPLEESDYHGAILKNRKKYFIFLGSGRVSRKHDHLYRFFQVHTSSIDNVPGGNFLKSSSFYFPSKEIEKKLKNDSLEDLNQYEFLRLINFLDKHNPKREYYSLVVEKYSTLDKFEDYWPR